ncbi:MAG: hypothetical protein WKG01_33960 [Kofleriaceae bacterium]
MLVFGMMRSLGGYVDDAAGTLCMRRHDRGDFVTNVVASDAPGPSLRPAIAPVIDELRSTSGPSCSAASHGSPERSRPLRLVGPDRIGEDVVQLMYVPV